MSDIYFNDKFDMAFVPVLGTCIGAVELAVGTVLLVASFAIQVFERFSFTNTKDRFCNNVREWSSHFLSEGLDDFLPKTIYSLFVISIVVTSIPPRALTFACCCIFSPEYATKRK